MEKSKYEGWHIGISRERYLEPDSPLRIEQKRLLMEELGWDEGNANSLVLQAINHDRSKLADKQFKQ